MEPKFLKQKGTDEIYAYSSWLAERDDMEPVAEEIDPDSVNLDAPEPSMPGKEEDQQLELEIVADSNPDAPTEG